MFSTRKIGALIIARLDFKQTRRSLQAAISRFVDVSSAIVNSKLPVVALESAVITHGLPYPQNLEVGRELETIIRENACQPATVAVINGKLIIGVSDAQLQQLAKSAAENHQNENGKFKRAKVALRDLPYHLNNNTGHSPEKECHFYGGTTVSATLHAAHLAGIRVFATGGIGGVHRGAETSFDISSDLIALSKTPVAVVCAGVKSILDVSKTVEYLETHSVPVVVFGDTSDFPGFYSSRSGVDAPFSTDSISKVADIFEASKAMGLKSGTLVACPIPDEFMQDGVRIEAAIRRAISECRTQSVNGRAVTPYVLARVAELTQGATVRANIALLKNNAMIASQLASELHVRETQKIFPVKRLGIENEMKPFLRESCQLDVFAVGATILDVVAVPHAGHEQGGQRDGATKSGTVSLSCGGVARNHADALTRLGHEVCLLTATASDNISEFFKLNSAHMNIIYTSDQCDESQLSVMEKINQSAAYVAVHDFQGDLQFGVSNVNDVLENLTGDVILANSDKVKHAKVVLADGNLSVEALNRLGELCSEFKKPFWFDPADASKVEKLFSSGANQVVTSCTPNLREFAMLLHIVLADGKGLLSEKDREFLASVFKIASQSDGPNLISKVMSSESSMLLKIMQIYLPKCDTLIVKMANFGTLVFESEHVEHIKSPELQGEKMVSVSGAGDCFNSGYLSGVLQELPISERCQLAKLCAMHSLRDEMAVPESLKEVCGTKFE